MAAGLALYSCPICGGGVLANVAIEIEHPGTTERPEQHALRFVVQPDGWAANLWQPVEIGSEVRLQPPGSNVAVLAIGPRALRQMVGGY